MQYRGMVGGLLVLAAACAPKAETPEQADARMTTESQAAQTAIQAVNQQFMAHFNAAHGDSVAALYAENGRMMAPNMPSAVGRAAMATELNAMGAMKPNLTLTTTSVAANGPIAIEAGTYKLMFTPPGAKDAMTDTGKYLVHWHKMGDKWMLVDDIWNSDLPAMPEPAPAKKP